MFQLSLCFQYACCWHLLFSPRRGGLWPTKVSRKGWRTRCVRRKCNHKSSHAFRSQCRIVPTVHAAGQLPSSVVLTWLEWEWPNPLLFLTPAGCHHQKFTRSCGLILSSLFPFSACFQYFRGIIRWEKIFKMMKSNHKTVYDNSIFFYCESSGNTEYTEIGVIRQIVLVI